MRRKPQDFVCIKVVRGDGIPAFGAWCDGSLKSKQGKILLNVEACLGELVDDNGKPVKMNRAGVVITTLMHEFGHALEDVLGLEHDEARIENATSRFYK